MRISTHDLRAIVEKLLSHMDANGHSDIEISADYYWDVPQAVRYDCYQEPTKFDLGQLSDDWAELKKIQDGEADPISYALVWLSSILRRVGETSVE